MSYETDATIFNIFTNKSSYYIMEWFMQALLVCIPVVDCPHDES